MQHSLHSAQTYHWILASGSPRRRELLAPLPVTFTVIKPDILEQRQAGESPVTYALRNAAEKSAAVRALSLPAGKPCVLISADTFVVLGDELLEKPTDPDHATKMLERLSGQTHQVITAFHIARVAEDGAVQEKGQTVHTAVTFKDLSAEEIAYYTGTDEPYDKAGSYALQGLGAFLVEKVEGSYSNVIGLPVDRVFDCLRTDFGIMLWQ